MTRCVAGAGNDTERADFVTVVDQSVRLRANMSEAKEWFAGFARVQREIAMQHSGFAGPRDQFRLGQRPCEGVERTDMVEMGMSQSDAGDGIAERARSLQDRVLGAREVCVHQSESIVLTNQKTIEDAEAREAVKIVGFADERHRIGEPSGWAERRWL